VLLRGHHIVHNRIVRPLTSCTIGGKCIAHIVAAFKRVIRIAADRACSPPEREIQAQAASCVLRSHGDQGRLVVAAFALPLESSGTANNRVASGKYFSRAAAVRLPSGRANASILLYFSRCKISRNVRRRVHNYGDKIRRRLIDTRRTLFYYRVSDGGDTGRFGKRQIDATALWYSSIHLQTGHGDLVDNHLRRRGSARGKRATDTGEDGAHGLAHQVQAHRMQVQMILILVFPGRGTVTRPRHGFESLRRHSLPHSTHSP